MTFNSLQVVPNAAASAALMPSPMVATNITINQPSYGYDAVAIHQTNDEHACPFAMTAHLVAMA